MQRYSSRLKRLYPFACTRSSNQWSSLPKPWVQSAAMQHSAGGDVALHVQRLSEHAVMPSRGSKDAAGYDLTSAYDVTIPGRGKALAKTDIAIAVPPGHYGRIAPRSSLAWKSHIDVGAGVIDADYRGNVGVVLFNLGEDDFQVKRGDRVAQLILERISTPDVVEVDTLPDTERGVGGFGSTGQ